MPKYSIIIPVYNTEKYLKNCLKSIFEQTYQDFEVICLNDGSTDNSLSILKKYKDKITIINQKHIGVSETRNIGIEKATGEYFIFVDSDDSIEKDLLERINNVSNNKPDLIRYGINKLIGKEIYHYPAPSFKELSGVNAFKEIVKNEYVDSPCIYAFRREFYLNKQFQFLSNVYHEDFGLIPKIIVKAEKVTSISYPGYNYYKRSNSIMNNASLLDKKIEDMLLQGELLFQESLDSKEFYSFIANSLISYSRNITDKGKKKLYINRLEKLKVSNYLLKDTIPRKLKYLLCKYNLKVYIKLFFR